MDLKEGKQPEKNGAIHKGLREGELPMKITARILLLATALVTGCWSDSGDTSTGTESITAVFCPDDGTFRGMTSQSRPIVLMVNDCGIEAWSYEWRCGSGAVVKEGRSFKNAQRLSDETFVLSPSGYGLDSNYSVAFGKFTTHTEASGTISAPDCTDRKTGDALVVTWDASYDSSADTDAGI